MSPGSQGAVLSFQFLSFFHSGNLDNKVEKTWNNLLDVDEQVGTHRITGDL